MPTSEITRYIKPDARYELIAAAGGRCELCNDFVFAHHLTKEPGYFGNFAHIRAFSTSGPRGDGAADPALVHDVENLMLLCTPCHKLVDDDPVAYTIEKLCARSGSTRSASGTFSNCPSPTKPQCSRCGRTWRSPPSCAARASSSRRCCRSFRALATGT